MQLGIAAVPWVLYGNWGIMMVTFTGTLLALVTGAMPQWMEEKRAGPRLKGHSVHVLTRGNGHRHIMVFVGSPGSYNLEVMATAGAWWRPETLLITSVLAVLWAGLLLCMSGLKANSWFMVGIGGLGMLQNVYAAGASRTPEWTGLKIKPFRRKPTIVARQMDETNDGDADVNIQEAAADVASLDDWLGRGHAAIVYLLTLAERPVVRQRVFAGNIKARDVL